MKTICLLLVLLASMGITATTTYAADTPEQLLKDAQQLQRNGNLLRAVESFKQFLQKYPDHTQAIEAHYQLGKSYDGLGQIEESIAALKNVATSKNRKYRNRTQALHLLGNQHGSLKQYKEALRVFEALLGEGAGLYEDEVLNLAAGYYAILGQVDEAAAKFNILKRKKESPLAEEAAYKLCVLWIKNERQEPIIESIQDLANAFPRHRRLPELLLRAADFFREKRQFKKSVALCDQLKTRYPKNVESQAGQYLVGMCLRDQEKFAEAIAMLDEVGKDKRFKRDGLAAEALFQAADIYMHNLSDPAQAMQRYEDAATLARESNSLRTPKILEQCYFRLAEHHYLQKDWPVALEYYLLLRETGTKLNVLGRILTCQRELDASASTESLTEGDLDQVRQKITENPGTAIAAEAEVFLLDRKLAPVLKSTKVSQALADEYRKLLKKYSKQVLATDNLESYIHAQIGNALFYAQTTGELKQAIASFEQALAVNPSDDNPYKRNVLEHLALAAERAGDKPRAVRAYDELFRMSKQQLAENKDDEQLQQQTLDYLKSLVTRADTSDLIEQSLQMCRDTIQQHGQLSDLSRGARFYMGELHYLKKDYSAAAREFGNFIRVYGPEQDSLGDVHNGPWNPKPVDEKVAQIYEAAIRIAHSWYVQGHDQNTIKAHRWIAKNMPHNNQHMAEVQYWLAMELGKGKQGETRTARSEQAEALWKNVVNTSFNFQDPKFASSYHFWVKPKDARFQPMQKYVKTACLRAGELFTDLKEHELAAGCFAQYIKLYPRQVKQSSNPADVKADEMYDIAHYSLGRQYAVLGYTDKLIDHYKAYNSGLRDSRFRVSALRLMGYHAGQAQRYDAAVDAYATLLDEYGPNHYDDKGNVIPVPTQQRLRRGNTKWNGIRLPPPESYDDGQIRYALGFLYWRQNDWQNCTVALKPFVDDESLKKKKSRPQALFMLGQSHFRLYDYTNGSQALQILLRDHPRFEAIQEAYVLTARGLAETEAWSQLDLQYRRFIAEWPTSDRRPHMDLYAALSLLGQGQRPKGLANLKSLADGETYEDVKADACYHLALDYQTGEAANNEAARQYFVKSVQTYARPRACLEGAKCCIALQDWNQAHTMLDKLIRYFPDGDPRLIEEGKKLLPQVSKEIAKANERK